MIQFLTEQLIPCEIANGKVFTHVINFNSSLRLTTERLCST